VAHRAGRPRSREKRVERIEFNRGENRYLLVARAGAVETRRSRAVRGVVLKSEVLSLDAWIDALSGDLATEAKASEQSRLALDELLRG
ncbi:MAG: hypothetical protein ACR2MU_09590, partial [Gaiellaceae bacterium]